MSVMLSIRVQALADAELRLWCEEACFAVNPCPRTRMKVRVARRRLTLAKKALATHA